MRNIKRINPENGRPTTYIVWEGTTIIGIYATKKEAREVIKQ